MYNSRAGGGEGHLEVAKNIYYSNKDMCHMVLSLKPFGHALHPVRRRPVVVVNQYKDMIYLPVETSGEGEINAHSRVQMALGEAKVKAREEMERILEQTGARWTRCASTPRSTPSCRTRSTACPTPRASSAPPRQRRARGRADGQGRRAPRPRRPRAGA